MSDALNDVLARTAPALARCLSPLGRRAEFPPGVLAQTRAAQGCELNATIGQVTDGAGLPLSLPTMEDAVPGLDPASTFLYGPQAGDPGLRALWARRQQRLAGDHAAPTTTPMVTLGLTHGVSLVSDLFADADTDVVLPWPTWGNYQHVFGLRHAARFVEYPFYDGDGFNVTGFVDALSRCAGKAIVVVNFPANPAGYSPTEAERDAIVDAVVARRQPTVVLLDDAYQGMVWEPRRVVRSLFWDLHRRADPEHHVLIRLDGATKELLFFGGRVGFLTANVTGAAEEALLSKLMGLARATVSVPPGPSQALVKRALEAPDLDAQIAVRFDDIRARFHALRGALEAMDRRLLRPLPCNAGCFALVEVAPTLDADHLRRHLIARHSTGLVSETNRHLRICFTSARESDLPEIVARLEKGAAEVAAL
jgi:aspartate/methionine/tyrosine aminotransferase